jgi:hypothetical protein
MLPLLLLMLAGAFPAVAATTEGSMWEASEFPVRDVPLPPPEDLGPARPATDPNLPTAPPPDTDHGYVIVEDSQWEVNIFQDDVDLILERWENSSIGPYPDMGIYESDSLHFGQPPDELDDDPRIYLMWFDIGPVGDGFFFWFDEYPDGFTEYPSNECEVLYLNSNATHGPSTDYMLSVIAHEFEHMIHWKYDDDEDIWVDEGMAEFAMWLYGRPDQIAAFNENPDLPLTEWGGMGEENYAHYIKAYLWSLYFFERYGGRDAVYAVVHESANSIAGYENVLDDLGCEEDVADVFADWAVANFLDDPTLADGRYGYVGEELPPFSVVDTYAAYPVPDQTESVGHWATDYYRFCDFGGISTLELGFDGADSNVFAVWALVLRGDGSTEVRRMSLDPETQAGTLGVARLNTPDNEVILVVAGVSDYGSGTYLFNAEPNSAGVGDWVWNDPTAFGGGGAAVLSLSAGPNPTRGHVLLEITWQGTQAETPSVAVYDAMGRLVRSLATPSQWLHGNPGSGLCAGDSADEPGTITLTWNGHDASGRSVAPGVYYARAKVEGRVRGERLVVIP